MYRNKVSYDLGIVIFDDGIASPRARKGDKKDCYCGCIISIATGTAMPMAKCIPRYTSESGKRKFGTMQHDNDLVPKSKLNLMFNCICWYMNFFIVLLTNRILN